MQTISVITHFDCTPTGTKSYRKLQNGYVDNSGKSIATLDDWNFSRNQQRNWETILQCVSLQTQPMNVSEPQLIKKKENTLWTFSFGIEHRGIFTKDNDQLGLLKEAVHGVPMIVGLDETYREGFLLPYLIAKGDNQNIVFDIIENME